VPPGTAERRRVDRLLAELPDAGSIPRVEGELAFTAPWELRALSMVMAAYQAGHFQWLDFQRELVSAIQEWEDAPQDQRGEWHYYRHWLRALERLVADRGIAAADEIDHRADEYLSGHRDPKHHG
jgi:nitrile hydratase accessory protein